nr:transposase [Nitrospira sp.]
WGAAIFVDTSYRCMETIEMVSRRSYSREFKIGICQEILGGQRSRAQIVREHGLTPSMVDRWVDQYKVLGVEAFPNSGGVVTPVDFDRVRELEALVGRLTLENEFLKAAVKKGREGLLETEPS